MKNYIKLINIFCCLLFLAFFYQCKEETDTGTSANDSTSGMSAEEVEAAENLTLPYSTGTEFTLLLVVDNELNTTEFRQSLYDALHDPFPGLVSEESSFKLTIITADAFAGLHKRQANVLFVSSQINDPVMNRMLDIFSQETIAEAIKTNEMLEKENVWARPQEVFYAPAQSKEGIISILTTNKRRILTAFDLNERRRVFSIIYSERGKNEMTSKLEAALKVEMKIPSIYRLAKEASNPAQEEKLKETGIKSLFWFRNDTRNIGNNILVYIQDYKGPEQLKQDYIINLRDKVGEAFIPGPTDTSFMKTEPLVQPDMSHTTLNGLPTVINRGHWRVEGDFMGGPFTNFTVLDEANSRIITLDGFVYAPDQPKLAFIKRLEIIFSTLKVE